MFSSHVCFPFQKIPKVLYIISQENLTVKLNHPKKDKQLRKELYCTIIVSMRQKARVLQITPKTRKR